MKDPVLILIVEDNPGSLMLATVLLEADGFAVAGAGSAEEARTLLTHRTPDIILMDIQLPGPLHERAARAAGCAGFIAKPWMPEALTRDVRGFLGAGSEARR